MYDHELTCLLFDGPVLRDAGLDPSAFIGRPIEATLPAEHLERLVSSILGALDGASGSLRHTSSSSGRTYEYDIAPLRLDDGPVTAAFLVGRDITERL